jgi:oligoendopeptidase F
MKSKTAVCLHPATPAPAADTASDLGDLPEWELDDLYPGMDSQAVRDAFAEAAKRAQAFRQACQGRLAEMAAGGGAALGRAVADYEAMQELIGRIMSYAGLLYAGDTSDPIRAKFYGDAQDKITTISTDLLFFELELNRIEDAVMEEALGDPDLGRYRPWIEDLRKEKPHQLDDRSEQLFHEKSVTGRSAWNRLFDDTMSALRFTVDGRELGIEATLNLLVNPDEARRRQGHEALAKTLGDNIRLFTLITNTLVKDKEISDRWRGFADIADSRHLANRVEREVVDALESAVADAFPRLSHRYYALKARWFGKERLDSWDRNAPLPHADTRIVAWADARDTVLKAYGGFDGRMAEIAGRFFDKGWIDAPVRPGKSPGAFAHPTVPSAHPYVLVNYQGKTRDVMTLAHELGHGVHQVLAARQGALMANTPLTLAETASVFGEMLTFRSLLAATEDAKTRKALLASKVEDMINTVVRQIAFYRFERRLHTERREGELTSERIGELWMSVQGESLGPAIALGEGYETFWSYIPHFIHSPFYVYAYAFGDCLVNSLYGVYEKSREGFAERYFDMLRAGGSKHHSELLAPFGLDASDPKFWSIGLDLISRMIDELEALEA